MGWLSGSDSTDTRAVEARVQHLENQVAQLWQAVHALGRPAEPPPANSVQPSPGPDFAPAPPDWTNPRATAWSAQAHQLKEQGKLIEAIKLVREHTQWGLKQSKDYVDGL